MSLLLKNASIVDPFWGPGFALVAMVTVLQLPVVGSSSLLLLVLVCIWALRLGIYLGMRNIGEGEDFRYVAMRKQAGESFALHSLFSVFFLQGLLLWLISWPIQAAIVAGGSIGPWQRLGFLLWGVGFCFEAVGDWQLSRFKARPQSAGQVMDQGLWRYTRHPNYFGDALLWWGYGCFALGAGQPLLLFSPLLMNLLLVKVSGVALLEKEIHHRRPAYREYIRRTSAFIPWFPLPKGKK